MASKQYKCLGTVVHGKGLSAAPGDIISLTEEDAKELLALNAIVAEVSAAPASVSSKPAPARSTRPASSTDDEL